MDYREEVCTYWAEFKSNGKQDITLADVLRHESGLAWLDHTFKIDDFMVENLKKNKVGQIFEVEPPHFPGTGGADDTPTNREYHTITRGCILNEIVRRVDPQNRTIGEIIKQVLTINLQIQLVVKGVFLSKNSIWMF